MYEIIQYDPEFKEQIVQLQRHLWRGDVALNTMYFDWKYEQNPYLEEPFVYLAVSAGRLVGMRGMFGSRWQIGSPPADFLIPSADDLVIAPDHRNRGLFGRIMRTALEDLASRGHEYVFSLSPGPVTLTASLASGWRAVGSMRPAHRQRSGGLLSRLPVGLGKLPLLWRYADRLAFLRPPSGRRAFVHLDRLGGETQISTAQAVRVERAPRIDAMVELVRRLGHDGRLRHVRDEPYLAWRYRNPLHEYRFLFRGGDRLEGYLVLQAYRLAPERGVNIVDWEATTPGIRAELLRAALDWGRFLELTIWTAALPEDTLALLSAAGFVPLGSGSPIKHSATVLVCQVHRSGPASDPILGGRRLLEPANWDMRMTYSMAG